MECCCGCAGPATVFGPRGLQVEACASTALNMMLVHVLCSPVCIMNKCILTASNLHPSPIPLDKNTARPTFIATEALCNCARVHACVHLLCYTWMRCKVSSFIFEEKRTIFRNWPWIWLCLHPRIYDADTNGDQEED